MTHLPNCKSLADRECGVCQCPEKPMTRLTPEQVQEIEEYWPGEEDRKHFETCWRVHEQCAIARLIASHRAVEEERDVAEKIVRSLCELFGTFHPDCIKFKLSRLEQQLTALQAEATRLREALGKIEWTSEKETLYCQWCAAYKDEGHKPNCFIGQALTGQEAKGVQVYGPGDEQTGGAR